jgi:hypothetical protein
MYWSSADFSGWFRLRGKSRQNFDIIISTKSVFFKFRFWGFEGAAARQPPLGWAPDCHIYQQQSLFSVQRHEVQSQTGEKPEDTQTDVKYNTA